MNGLHLDTERPFWELKGTTDFARLFRALTDFLPELPEGCILYFEGGSPDREVREFFETHAIPEQANIALGTVWPRPERYHVPATPENLKRLETLAEGRAEPELADHFHVYRKGKVLLQWHDAFDQPMLLDGDIPESKVKDFARKVSMEYKLRP